MLKSRAYQKDINCQVLRTSLPPPDEAPVDSMQGRLDLCFVTVFQSPTQSFFTTLLQLLERAIEDEPRIRFSIRPLLLSALASLQ